LLEFLALGTLRLARAGGLATTTECTLGAAATTATAGTATGTDGTAATGTAAGTPATATTAAASAGTSVGQATVGVLTHDAGRGHPGTGTAAGARSALAGRGTTALLRAAGAGTLAGTGHALRAGEGIVAWTRPAGAGGSAAGASGSALSAVGFGAGLPPGLGAALAPGLGAALAPGLEAPEGLEPPSAGASLVLTGSSWRSLRATGASMVEEAERTNSPMSCSFCRTTLLGCPSSLASSRTRTLATILLSRSGRQEGADR